VTGALLVALALSADPCDAGPPAPAKDERASRAYREVGDEALARGDLDAAQIAYREAVRQDPGDPRARAAFAEVCRGRPADAFARGLKQMKAGDCKGAVASFAQARSRGPDPSAALLQGVCLYELDQDARARPALEEARQGELKDTADLYLALIAVRQGRASDAEALLSPLAGSPDASLSAAARELGLMARELGRLVVSVGFDGNYDTNAYLLPDFAYSRGVSDESGAIAGSAVLRPLGVSGPYGRAYLQHRNQVLTDFFDATNGGGALGWQLGRGRRYARLEYGYDAMWLAAAPYLSAQRLDAIAGWDFPFAALFGTYEARLEQILTPALSGYSGLVQQGTAWVQFGDELTLALGYRALRAATDDPVLSYWEHGPRAAVGLRASPNVRLRVEGGYAFRPYDLFDSKLGAARADQLLEALAVADVDLDPSWEVEATVLAQKAISNVADFAYTRVVGGVALSWTAAPW